MTELTVAISTRDRPDALARCLDALFSGSVAPSEVVVVDQSDMKLSREIVERRQEQGLPVRYISQAEGGLAVSQDAAVRAAVTGVIAVTDDDCVPDDSWVSAVAQSFASDPQLGLLTGRVLPLPSDDPALVPVSTRPSSEPTVFRHPTDPWRIGSGNNFALRREWYEAVGGCDVRLGPGAPGRGALDMDLFYRLVRAGASARYDPDVLVLHEQKTRAERRSRRPDYGFGMGACCLFWSREGDRNAMPALRRWFAFRLGLLLRAVRQGRLRGAYDEVLMVVGTVRGIGYGRRAAR